MANGMTTGDCLRNDKSKVARLIPKIGAYQIDTLPLFCQKSAVKAYRHIIVLPSFHETV